MKRFDATASRRIVIIPRITLAVGHGSCRRRVWSAAWRSSKHASAGCMCEVSRHHHAASPSSVHSGIAARKDSRNRRSGTAEAHVAFVHLSEQRLVLKSGSALMPASLCSNSCPISRSDGANREPRAPAGYGSPGDQGAADAGGGPCLRKGCRTSRRSRRCCRSMAERLRLPAAAKSGSGPPDLGSGAHNPHATSCWAGLCAPGSAHISDACTMWPCWQCLHHTDTLSDPKRARSLSVASMDVVTRRPVSWH